MIESIEWLRLFILDHRSFEYIIIFFGAILGGDFALFIFGFLIGQDVLSTTSVIIFGFAGSLFPNLLWFFLGKTKIVSKFILFRHAETTTSIVTEAIDKLSRSNHFVALTIIKFIVGTPFILTMYVSKTNISFQKFIYYQSIAVLLSMLATLPVGFISGLGFVYVASVFNSIYATLGFVLLVAVIIVMIKLAIKKKFTGSVSA